jgi:formylglycine-generating enzyme required for sulfatase activity
MERAVLVATLTLQELKECLACHGSAGHPYKEVKSVRGVAEAADKPVSPHSSRNIDPDIKDMILIPEGEFLMGTDNRLKDERPAYVVYINVFYIDRFEVTNVAGRQGRPSGGFCNLVRRRCILQMDREEAPQGD